MKKHIIIAALCLGAVACQPYFEMVPPNTGPVVVREFNEEWYVSKDGAGVKNGADWNNAMSLDGFLAMLTNATTFLDDAGIYIQEGTYLVTEKDQYLALKKNIKCIRGGYSADLEYDDVSECDPALYPTIFTGDVDGDGACGEGDGAFAYVTDGNICFENITFRNFYQSAAQDTELGGKGSAVFGINGPYLSTSVDCKNCIFENNVNGVAGTSGHEGGPCAFISQGYFKAAGCVFRNNSANSRGGAFRTSGDQAVLFLNRCMFTGNQLTGGSFGSAIQCSAGVICANNCTMVGNVGNGSTLNGGGAFFLSNNTIIDNSAPDGANNAAFRCESKADRGTLLINNVLSNADAGGYGIIMNNGAAAKSSGYNVIKSVYLGSNNPIDPRVSADLVKDVVLTGAIDGTVWKWDVAQIAADMPGYANGDDVYNCVVTFDPSGYCKISGVGRAFVSWATAIDFYKDGRGEDRGDDAFQPGSYDPNLDE
ncbi:MAG: hypothetical protein IK008_03615 [Bacteroidales bacterium]|nr:hypothetical protein [Bacteroidales bacterium]